MPTCPVDVDGDPCNSPHDTWGGVAVHMWKKSDDAHNMAESKDEALVWLAQHGHLTDTSTDMPTTDTSSDTSPDTSSGGVEFPENPDADPDPDPEPDEEVVALSCGCEVDATGLSAGTYRCSEHQTRFKVS